MDLTPTSPVHLLCNSWVSGSRGFNFSVEMLLRPGLFCQIWAAEAVKFYNIAKTEAEVITKILEDFFYSQRNRNNIHYVEIKENITI